METFRALVAQIPAFSTLLWQLIVIAVFLTFRRAIIDLIKSAQSRKFTIKIGGQELSMDEASEQQVTLIADLQSQIAEIRKHLEAGPPDEALPELTPSQRKIPELSSILWVDDEAKNNSYFIEQLGRLGVRVDLARTTSDGLSMFDDRRYSAIISDMGRNEGGKFNFRAGFDLLKAVRERDAQIPFFIFCGARNAREHREEAMRLKADGITASASELYSLLNLEQLKRQA